jgi:hypothetical protein
MREIEGWSTAGLFRTGFKKKEAVLRPWSSRERKKERKRNRSRRTKKRIKRRCGRQKRRGKGQPRHTNRNTLGWAQRHGHHNHIMLSKWIATHQAQPDIFAFPSLRGWKVRKYTVLYCTIFEIYSIQTPRLSSWFVNQKLGYSLTLLLSSFGISPPLPSPFPLHRSQPSRSTCVATLWHFRQIFGHVKITVLQT